MTVHTTGKGDFERCLVLLLFLPLAAWSFNASTALACSSPGSGCAGWGCSPEEHLGVPRDTELEIWGSPLPGLPLPCFSQYQSGHICLDLPKSRCISDSFAQRLLKLMESLACVFGVPPCRRELVGFCCCYPEAPFELCNTHHHRRPLVLPSAFPC